MINFKKFLEKNREDLEIPFNLVNKIINTKTKLVDNFKGVLLKIEENLIMFILDEKYQLTNPSVGPLYGTFSTMNDNQIKLVDVTLEKNKIKEKIEIPKIYDWFDLWDIIKENCTFSFIEHVSFSCDKTIHNIMLENLLQDLVDELVIEYKKKLIKRGN